jgi:hypothetical protein
VSVADRRDPVASCWEWHGDGTAGEDGRGSGLAVMVAARAMGENRPSPTPASLSRDGGAAAGVASSVRDLQWAFAQGTAWCYGLVRTRDKRQVSGYRWQDRMS